MNNERPLKHEIASYLTLARLENHKLTVENRALKEQLGRLPYELLFTALGVGVVTGIIIARMIFR